MTKPNNINLNADNRFVDTAVLRKAYVSYRDTKTIGKPNFVTLDTGLELGIVSSDNPLIANAVSSILSCSLEDAKASTGGYIPDPVVERVQSQIISPSGVTNIWGKTGHRFVLSASAGKSKREIVASILVGKSKDTVFFFTGKYNNLKHSTMIDSIDLEMPDDNDPGKKWFDRFAFPGLDQFKPSKYHHIANFVVTKGHRGKGYSRLLLHEIIRYYSKDYIEKHNLPIEHCQHLLCGVGFWQIGDPPWLGKMEHLGFWLRLGAESFFIEHDWAPLSPVYRFGKQVGNLEYNQDYGLLGRYEEISMNEKYSDIHLSHRIGEVRQLAKNPRAKLQYFQACFDFLCVDKHKQISKGVS